MFDKSSSTTSTPSKWKDQMEIRMFGEDIDTNNIVDMSMLSMESKDTAPTSVVTDDHGGSIAEYSDCDGTEVSSVAHLREWLDDFGKHSKNHYHKNATVGKAPSNLELDRPVRPKVSRSTISAPPTPLPFNAANALSKRMSLNNGGNNNINKSVSVKTGVPSHSMARRKSIGIMNPRTTPVIYKPKVTSQDVQATDQGYASVAKLSAWLADDPTRTKKVRQIRRGANIIAKSRTFDKGLADVIVEQTNIRNGHVAGKTKDWMMKMNTTTKTETMASRTSTSENESSEMFGTPRTNQARSVDDDCSSTVNVADKMKWLSSAFKRVDSDADEGLLVAKKARTDFITARDERDDLTSRAKQLWRNKRSPMKENAQRPSTINKPCQLSSTKNNPIAVGDNTPASTNSVPVKPADAPTDSDPVTDVVANVSITEQPQSDDSKHSPVSAEKSLSPSSSIGFNGARQLLVERSKANGSSAKVVSRVQKTKAKYDRLRQNVIQLSAPHGLLKATWEADENGPGSGGTYVKTFREDHPKPKTLSELP